MKITDFIPGTKEWLKMRSNMIGASDAPVIMGRSPWTTPNQLWHQKMGLSTSPKQNEAMRRGVDLEPVARNKFIDLISYNFSPIVALHDSIPYMMASFDGFSENGQAVEIKCPGKEDHEKAMDGVIPEKYIPQLQHQMEVAGIQSMFYFSYSEKSHKILEIEKDNEYTLHLITEEKAFWDCMENLQAPELVDRDYIKREDKEWLQLSKEWIELSKIEERKEEIRKRLIDMCGQCNTMGGGIKLSKIPRKGNIDYKSIPELMGVDLEKYRKGTIETYRIGIF